MTLALSLRAMRRADLPAVLQVQSSCYGGEFLESPASFEAKLVQTEALQTCWVVADARSEQMLGYVFSLPVCAGTMPGLNASDYRLPAQPELLYLHDLAIAPAGRGQGLAPLLVDKVQERAEVLGLRRIGLIAVQDSHQFWQRQGFGPRRGQLPPWLQAKLGSFGPAARYLEARRAGPVLTADMIEA